MSFTLSSKKPQEQEKNYGEKLNKLQQITSSFRRMSSTETVLRTYIESVNNLFDEGADFKNLLEEMMQEERLSEISSEGLSEYSEDTEGKWLIVEPIEIYDFEIGSRTSSGDRE